VARTAAVLAEVRGMTIADIGDLTTRNFRALFQKAVPVKAASA
jgi:Tat protein secretion system quality control protein TatD with DNase activity